MRGHFQLSVRSLGLLSLCLLMLPTRWTLAQGEPVNVLTQHNDNLRTGANLNETILNTSNVNVNQFGKLFSRTVEGQIYAQPLYVSNLTIPNKGTHNVVFVATQQNNVYAFDADDPLASAPLWEANLAPSVPVPNREFGNRYGPYHDIVPELGIGGTPVIDLGSKTLYVVTFSKEDGAYFQNLHALDIATGEEKFGGPVAIEGSVPGRGYDAVGGVIPFRPVQHMQRPALLLVNGVLYVAFASHADTDPYHGWVFAYNPTTLEQLGIYCTTPNGNEGGIWQSGQGPAADNEGNVYFMTGNGTFDTNAGVGIPADLGDSFVKLKLTKDGLIPVDYFTPFNQSILERNDTDLGSAGPLLLPGTNRLVGGGKEGYFYLLDRDDMGHFRISGDTQIVQKFRASTSIQASPIYWNSPDGPLVYVWGVGDTLKAIRMVDGLFELTVFSQSSASVPRPSFPGGFLSLSANGGARGTGIVWTAVPTAHANSITVKGVLRAFDASDLANELWNSTQMAAFDDIGAYPKFSLPTIANGKVYVPSFSGQLHVFGLLPDNQPPVVSIITPTNGTTFKAPANIVLTAEAIDRDNDVIKVEFYSGKTRIGTAKTSPYRFTWMNVPVGNYTLTAVATDSGGATSSSAPINISVIAGTIRPGKVISIDFGSNGRNDGTRTLGAPERAGTVARTNWNNARGRDGGMPGFGMPGLVDDAGQPTGAQLAWSSNNVFLTLNRDMPGDVRMMKGYLDTHNTSITYVLVYDLPESFTREGYDVYVYFDGANGAASRTAEFNISTTKVTGTDLGGTDFSGTYTQAIGGAAGNYVVFPGLKGSRFTLAATPGMAFDGTPRAPINGIQIVAHDGTIPGGKGKK